MMQALVDNQKFGRPAPMNMPWQSLMRLHFMRTTPQRMKFSHAHDKY
jgi:hypothetical protein